MTRSSKIPEGGGARGRRPKVASTMAEVAQLAGVSKQTVSRALRGSPLVVPETKERVVAIAREHGYIANRNAQRLRSKRSNTIAVAVDFASLAGHRLSDPFHFELLADVARALGIRDQDVLLCSPHIDEARAYETMLASKGADGIIFVGQGGRETYLRQLALTAAPFVVWGAVSDDSPYCTVGSDNLRGGWLVGKRFGEMGRRRILFVGASGHQEFEMRLQGMKSALQQFTGTTEIEHLATDDLSYDNSYLRTRNYFADLKKPPDAIFAASDLIAIAVMAVVREAGLRVPADISIIGYNDIPFASHLTPSLTTVRQNTQQAGALLVEKLMQTLEGIRPKSVKLSAELVVRES
jgi:DNA-binding LacI/PurR family transcriptional regulator